MSLQSLQTWWQGWDEWFEHHPIELTLFSLTLEMIITLGIVSYFVGRRWKSIYGRIAERTLLPMTLFLHEIGDLFQYMSGTIALDSRKAEKIAQGRTEEEATKFVNMVRESAVERVSQIVESIIERIPECKRELDLVVADMAGSGGVSPEATEAQLSLQNDFKKIDMDLRYFRSQHFFANLPKREVTSGSFSSIDLDALVKDYERFLKLANCPKGKYAPIIESASATAARFPLAEQSDIVARFSKILSAS